MLCQEPFVQGVTVSGETATFEFTADENELAALLKRLIMAGVEVVEFQGRVESLEDAFMAITKGIMQ